MSRHSVDPRDELVDATRANGKPWYDVALVAWPSAEPSRAELRQAGRPRLLLVPEGCDPPITEDEFEDWVRTPADPRDVQARVETLRSRAMREVQPQLDADGRLHVGDRWVALSPIESRLVGTLLDHLGTVTSRERLMQAGWSSGVSSRKLDVRITRLRRRLESVGFTVRTVYSKGYVIDRIAMGDPRS